MAQKNLIAKYLFLIFFTVIISNFVPPEKAQAFPNKPLELMVIFPAGGPTDVEMRILARYTERILGQSIAVVNVAGAGGIVGWNTVPSKPKDGYHITCVNLPHIITFPLVQNTNFDYNTFEPLVMVSQDPTVWAVLADSKYQTLEDVLEDARKRPGQITVGTAGLYLAHHLAILQVEKEKGLKFATIPFRGSANSIAGLLGGQINLLSDTVSSMIRQGDRVRVLAVGAESRVDLAPDWPTFKEQGIESFIPSSDRGVAAPAGTKPEAVKILTEAFQKAASLPEYRKDMSNAGYVVNVFNPDESRKIFKEQNEMYKKIIEELGVKKQN